MSLAFYDKALYDKIHQVFDNVVNADESSAFSESVGINDVETQEVTFNGNKLVFPLISFWRTGNPPNLDQDGNYSSVLRGKSYIKGNDKLKFYRTFPVNISYQISIWSDNRREVDEIYRELCMLFFVDEPFLKIQVAKEDSPEGELIINEEFSLQLTDSSSEIDTTSFSDRGRIYRQDIMIEIPNAKMFYLSEKYAVKYVSYKLVTD